MLSMVTQSRLLTSLPLTLVANLEIMDSVRITEDIMGYSPFDKSKSIEMSEGSEGVIVRELEDGFLIEFTNLDTGIPTCYAEVSKELLSLA